MKLKGRVLLVDDDPIHRTVVGEVLKSQGYACREAANGREALDIARAQAPDLILTDLTMPVMNGWDLCAELRRCEGLANIPVAVLSGVAWAVPAGVAALAKPVQLPELFALLERLLGT